jgi:hypothetical protein
LLAWVGHADFVQFAANPDAQASLQGLKIKTLRTVQIERFHEPTRNQPFYSKTNSLLQKWQCRIEKPRNSANKQRLFPTRLMPRYERRASLEKIPVNAFNLFIKAENAKEGRPSFLAIDSLGDSGVHANKWLQQTDSRSGILRR